jgi:hypothetical protein
MAMKISSPSLFPPAFIFTPHQFGFGIELSSDDGEGTLREFI